MCAAVAIGGQLELPLTNATIRFTRCEDERSEGLSALTLRCSDREAILATAAARSLIDNNAALTLGGVRITLE